MIKDIITGIELTGKLADNLRTVTADSLIEYTKPARVEPIVLMDKRAVNLPCATDVMQTLTSLFAGYYLQAVALSVNVGRVDVIKLLDKLNPKRDTMGNFANNSFISNGVSSIAASLESADAYSYKLPVPGEVVSLESFGFEAIKTSSTVKTKIDDDTELTLKAEHDGNASDPAFKVSGNAERTQKILDDLTNLSVGKMLEVEIESNGSKAVFPIALRLITTGIGPTELVHILSQGNKDTSVKERWHMWRAGQLEFIRDLVMCQDLIDEHKKTLANDPTGIYAEIRKRRNGNKLSAIFSGSPSVATASNIVVMTQQTAKELERTVNGKLKDFRTREKIFKQTYTMMMVVIDPDWDHVTFYHRSIEIATDMSVKELKVSNKGKGPDVAEILKAYQLGNSPSF